jgi:hypothetical protein
VKYQTRQALRLLALVVIALAGGVMIALVLSGCTLVLVRGDVTGDIYDIGGHGNWTPAGRTPLKDLIHPNPEHH